MQIFQWLFKVTPAQAPGENTTHHTNRNIRYGKYADAKDIVLYKKRRVKASDHHHQQRHLGGKYLKPFAILCRKDVAKDCFNSTLNLRRVGSINRRRRLVHSMNKMKKEKIIGGGLVGSTHDHHNHKAHDDSAAHHAAAGAGNKVSPIGDNNNHADTNEQCGSVVENNKKDHKTKTMSRMKELLRWAAAAKSAEKGGKFLGKKVRHFRNRATLKAVPDEDQLTMESPKISFKWEVESSCSTTSSVYSGISMASSAKNIDQMMITSSACNMLSSSVSSTPIHCNPRKGNWITTDSEFVVLEL